MNAQLKIDHDSIDSLVCGLSTKDQEKRILVMLYAYVDETGTGSKDGICNIAKKGPRIEQPVRVWRLPNVIDQSGQCWAQCVVHPWP